MAMSVSRFNGEQFEYASNRVHSDGMFGSVFPEERIGGSFEAERRLTLPWRGIIAAVATSAYLIFFEVGLDRPDWAFERSQHVTAAQSKMLPSLEEQTVRVQEPVSTSQGSWPDVPGSPAKSEPEQPAAVVASVEVKEQPEAPLPPPTLDRSDPYQVRALSSGLHPGLSRALLVQLSLTDFRNAAYAVRTALAKTPDGKTFVWPRGLKSNVARFKVRFVAGALHDCRRYVVEVIKDGWVTTAQPMEKCAPENLTQRAKSNKLKSTL